MMQFLVDHLWQSTLFVVVAWLLTLVLQNNSARVRYWIWLAASIKFLIPFSLLTALGSQLSWREATTESIGGNFVAVVQQMARPLGTPGIALPADNLEGFDWALALLALWVVGSILLLARWARNFLEVASTVRTASVVAIEAPIAIKSTVVMSEPGVVGVLHPVMLLPDGIESRLTPAQLQAVIAHELCHVRRRDNLTATIHMMVEVLFWFHPLVWWIGARLVEERERACDEGVVALGNEPRDYAEGILKVCQFYVESRLKCVSGVSGADLKKRVEVIMMNRGADALSAMKKLLLSITAAMAVAIPMAIGATDGGVQPMAAIGGPAAFDEVIIRAAPGAADQMVVMNLWGGLQLNAKASLRELVGVAYGVDPSRVFGGPDWISDRQFDVDARSRSTLPAPEASRDAAYRRMTLAMLQERFGLVVHKETQLVDGYALRIDGSSARLQSHRESGSTGKGQIAITLDPPRWTGRAIGTKFLASDLERYLRRPVLDQTGLQGRYDFAVDGPLTTETLPTILRDHLGLRLDPMTTRGEVIVVDFAREPTLDEQPRAATSAEPASRAIPAAQIAVASRVEIAAEALAATESVAAKEAVTAKESVAAEEAIPARAAAPVQSKPELINLKFDNIDIRRVLLLLARVSGRTIELDPAVEGPVTVQLKAVTIDVALQEIARGRNLIIRTEGDTIRLQPAAG